MTSKQTHHLDRRQMVQGGSALLAGLLVSGAGSVHAVASGDSARHGARNRAQEATPLGGKEGVVFVGTNHNNTLAPDLPANQVIMYRRSAEGELTMIDAFDTGGQGSGPSQRFAGDGLGSGNSLQLSTDNRWLFVTNAGSNTLSVFDVGNDGLTLTDIVPTGDGSQGHRFPNSVTQHEGMVYVLHAADEGSITGFRLNDEGRLSPIPGSTRTLNANQEDFPPDPLFNPTQVSFTPEGGQLVVTIKDGPAEGVLPLVTPTGPGRVLVFSVDSDGLPSDDFVQTDFDNRGPFGFSFDNDGRLLVAEFLGGGKEIIDGMPAVTAAAGSYHINEDGTLQAITAAVKNHQLDTCWLVNNGMYAYGSNYASGTISSYAIGADGELTVLAEVAGETDDPGNKQGSTPLDARISQDGRFLYVVLPGAGKVGGWRIEEDGSLSKIGEFGGLTQTVDGDKAPGDFTGLGSPAGIEVI